MTDTNSIELTATDLLNGAVEALNIWEDGAIETSGGIEAEQSRIADIEEGIYSAFYTAYCAGITPADLWVAVAASRGYPHKVLDVARGDMKIMNKGAATKPSSTLRKVTARAKNYFAEYESLTAEWDDVKKALKTPAKTNWEKLVAVFEKLDVVEQDDFIIKMMEIMAQANPINPRFVELCHAVTEANPIDNLVKADEKESAAA